MATKYRMTVCVLVLGFIISQLLKALVFVAYKLVNAKTGFDNILCFLVEKSHKNGRIKFCVTVKYQATSSVPHP